MSGMFCFYFVFLFIYTFWQARGPRQAQPGRAPAPAQREPFCRPGGRLHTHPV